MTRPSGCAVASAVALRLRRKCLKLRELRDMRACAYMRATRRSVSLTGTFFTRNRATRATTRVFAQPLAQPHTTSRNHTMSEGKKGGLRAEMPEAAALMDEIRALFGQAWADAALREGLRLQREHALLAATQGPAAADRWLRLQRPAEAALSLRQRDMVVGRLAGRAQG